MIRWNKLVGLPSEPKHWRVKIEVKQHGLATGKVVPVRRLHGKSNPLKIEVKQL